MGNRRNTKAKRRPGVAGARQESSGAKFTLIAVGVVVAVAVLMGVLALLSRQPGQAVETQGNRHIDPDAAHAPYNTDPPTSGPHAPYVAPWGVSREPVQDEVQVHNLEDGGVVIQYGEGVSPGEVQELARISGDYERILLAPRPSLPEDEIVLTAWGRIMRLDGVNEGQVRVFIEAFEGIDHHTAGG